QRDSGTKKDKRTQNQGLTAVPHSVPHWKIRRSSGTNRKKKAGKSPPRPIHPLGSGQHSKANHFLPSGPSSNREAQADRPRPVSSLRGFRLTTTSRLVPIR